MRLFHCRLSDSTIFSAARQLNDIWGQTAVWMVDGVELPEAMDNPGTSACVAEAADTRQREDNDIAYSSELHYTCAARSDAVV